MDEQLTAIARAHTHDMVDHDFVGHVSPRTGGPVDRVHRAGLTPTFVSENVGRGYTAEEAEQGFMSSPGHRANIVDPRPAAGRHRHRLRRRRHRHEADVRDAAIHELTAAPTSSATRPTVARSGLVGDREGEAHEGAARIDRSRGRLRRSFA